MSKDTTFSIRISSDDLEAIKRKAKQARMSQSDYVTRCCLGRQVVVIEDLRPSAGSGKRKSPPDTSRVIVRRSRGRTLLCE